MPRRLSRADLALMEELGEKPSPAGQRKLERLRQHGVIRTRSTGGEPALSIKENAERVHAVRERLTNSLSGAVLAAYVAGEPVERRALERAFRDEIDRVEEKITRNRIVGNNIETAFRTNIEEAVRRHGPNPLVKHLRTTTGSELSLAEFVSRQNDASALAGLFPPEVGELLDGLRFPSIQSFRAAAREATIEEYIGARDAAANLWALATKRFPQLVELIRCDEVHLAWLALLLIVVRRSDDVRRARLVLAGYVLQHRQQTQSFA
jgi:hypothetical protein